MVKLTESIISIRTKMSNVESVKRLNCWGCDLDDISILAKMPNVEILSLSVNKITTLQPIAGCTHLKELYLRSNCIDDLNEIQYLQRLRELRVLWLTENPCVDVPDYRSFVLRTLPLLTTLDNRPVTTEELAVARNQQQHSPQRSPPPAAISRHSSISSNLSAPENHSYVDNHIFEQGSSAMNGCQFVREESRNFKIPSTDDYQRLANSQYVGNDSHVLGIDDSSAVTTWQHRAMSQSATFLDSTLIAHNGNDNVLSAVLLLLDELDGKSLSIVIRESEKRLRRYH